MKSLPKKAKTIISLIIALIAILIGGVVFIGAVSGWFDDPKTVLDPEYYSKNPELIDLSTADFEKLIGDQKSFLVFVDQTDCTTADRLRGYVNDYSAETGISFYKMMFKDVKESSLHQSVKYYPSVVVVDKGKIRGFMKADSDADSDAYNDYGAFKVWLAQYL